MNIELGDIKTILLQASKIHKKQIEGNIYSIVNKLWNVIYGDIERQIYHIQKLLADELDKCKEK